MAEQPVIRVDVVEQVDARTGESVEGDAQSKKASLKDGTTPESGRSFA